MCQLQISIFPVNLKPTTWTKLSCSILPLHVPESEGSSNCSQHEQWPQSFLSSNKSKSQMSQLVVSLEIRIIYFSGIEHCYSHIFLPFHTDMGDHKPVLLWIQTFLNIKDVVLLLWYLIYFWWWVYHAADFIMQLFEDIVPMLT